ncbi:AAA family ATPase [Bacillus litorisediminis]|uniref:AAA family ATPase n=1 Tax=Bacillus litorisediminis TaxID=2922713 RepID=UPI001FAD155A|nr:MoxR family ATPase [Bacillus litorisediminis]
MEASFTEAVTAIQTAKKAVSSFIVGQEETLEEVFWTILAQGHALLEGLPGLGKTMLVKSLSEVLQLQFSRIQFTPDLMPSDITGTMILQKDSEGNQRFQFHEGPVFSNFVLADEINRATPKTQSALLEAMGEKTVTIMGETKKLPSPFFVLATQNPLDLEGTYPLPEAQLDRFLCKIHVPSPTQQELKEIAKRTLSVQRISLEKVMDREQLIDIQKLVGQVLISDEMLDFASHIIMNTSPQAPDSPQIVKENVRYGAGPRGMQSILQLARARALYHGRYHVSIGDLKRVSLPALRHRIHLSFEGEASGISTDTIVGHCVEHVKAG